LEILFIQEPIEDFYTTKFRNYPLGLLLLASQLDKKLYKIKFLDFRFFKKPKIIKTPALFSYLNYYYTKENNIFLNYKLFGYNNIEIKKIISNMDLDVVILNSMFTAYQHKIIELAKLIKEVKPSTCIILGGVNASFNNELFYNTGYFDVIVLGEGEEALPKIISDLNSYKGLISDNGKGFIVDDLNKIKAINLNFLNNNLYVYNKKKYTMLLSSRGCLNNCVFCSINKIYSNTYREVDIDKTIFEIESLNKDFDIEVFDFQDDDLLHNNERIKTLFNMLLNKINNVNLEFMASNGLNSKNLDFELLSLMKKLGFKKLDISLVGTVNNIKLKRPDSLIAYEKVLEYAKKLSMPITTYIIIGYPESSIKDMYNTFTYLKTKKTLIAPSVFYNTKGMAVYEKFKDYEYLSEDLARRSSSFNLKGIDFTRDDIFKLFKEILVYNARRSNLL